MNPRVVGVALVFASDGLRLAAPNTMNLLPSNEHPIDRAVRVLLGIGLLSLVFVGPQTPWGWLGLIPLLTGALGSCPLYTVFGIGTCEVKPRNARRA